MSVYTFRQSWLNTFFMCPEKALLDYGKFVPRVETDATAVGTAMHAGIEHRLLTGCSRSDAHEAAQAEWEKLLPEVKFVKVAKPQTAEAYVHVCLNAWWDNVLPQLGTPQAVEQRFKLFLFEHKGHEVWISGTIDHADDCNPLWDWKTGARDYEQWEVDRFKIQPTMYTYAWKRLMELQDIEVPPHLGFSYAVMMKGKQGKTQVVHTYRHEGHWRWLENQLRSIVDLFEAKLDHWPLNDQGWWCSEKWCEVWDQCKGAHI